MLSLSAFLGLFWIQSGAVPPEEEEARDYQSFRFALIQIPVWVTHKNGMAVPNLTRSDFTLFVDGRKAEVENFKETYSGPMELVFLLDLSGSMALGGKLAGSVDAMVHLTRRLRVEDRWHWVVFADGQVLEVLNHTCPENMDRVVEKISAYGKTSLFDALSTSNTHFSVDSRGNRALVLFTDGNDNASLITEDQLVYLLGILDVPVFAIGIADGFWPSTVEGEEAMNVGALRRFSEISGGHFFVAKSSNDIPVIEQQLEHMMRAHYMLSIVVERGPGERRHDIQVKTRKKSYQIRYRKGYIGFPPESHGGRR